MKNNKREGLGSKQKQAKLSLVCSCAFCKIEEETAFMNIAGNSCHEAFSMDPLTSVTNLLPVASHDPFSLISAFLVLLFIYHTPSLIETCPHIYHCFSSVLSIKALIFAFQLFILLRDADESVQQWRLSRSF